MHTQKLLDALRDLVRSEIAAELDRRAAGDENKAQQAEEPAKTTEKPAENQAEATERPAEQPGAQAERGAAEEIGQAERVAEAERASDPIVPLEGRGPEPTDKDRAALTAALKALISEQNDAAQEFRHLVREGKQRACSACYDWSDFECVVDFINYRRGLKNGRA